MTTSIGAIHRLMVSFKTQGNDDTTRLWWWGRVAGSAGAGRGGETTRERGVRERVEIGRGLDADWVGEDWDWTVSRTSLKF